MFVVIRRYGAVAGLLSAAEVARRVGEGLVPILRRMPGFRAYYAFVGEDGRPVSVSVVADRDAALAASARVREWVAANMGDLIPDPPEVSMGEMLVDAATWDAATSEEAAAAARETAAQDTVPHDALD